jgi:hypothetical protein
MKISEVAAIIATLPQDADAAILFDGATHAHVDAVWLAQSGEVVFADRSEPVYQDRDRMVGAVTQAENPYVRVEEMMGLPPLPDEDFD